MIALAADSTLATQIGDFGALVGLLLTLATLLTANRAAALGDLRSATDITRRQRVTELGLDTSLAATTFLVWLAGLSLAVRSASQLHPLADGGGLRAVFVVTWILLLGLISWQLDLVRRAFRLKPSV
jgi:hypothetical protein